MANPKDHYYIGDNIPNVLPNRIRFPNGRTKTDVSTYTANDLSECGYVGPVNKPNYDENLEIRWWNNDTKEWIVEEISLHMRWNRIREQRNGYLNDSDWILLPDCPLSQEVKDKVIVYRQQLRDITDTFATPEEVIWPDPSKL